MKRMTINLRFWQCMRYWIGLVLLSSMANCTSNDDPEFSDTDRQISYDINVGWFNGQSVTRGALVNALTSGSLWISSKIHGTTTYYFEKEVLSYGTDSWTTVNKYLWPDPASLQTLDFFAFYPSGDTNWTASSGATWTYTTPQANADQKDLMYAASLNQAKSTNGGVVPLNMKHALSAISFAAETQSSGLTVTIKGINVCNVNTTGTFVFPDASTVSDAGDNVNRWTSVGTKGNLSAGIATTTLTTTSQTLMATNGAVLMLPQTLTKWNLTDGDVTEQTGSYLAIQCRIVSNSIYVVGDAEHDGVVYVPFEGTFEAGKHYQFDMTFGFGYKPDGSSYGLIVHIYSSIKPWTITTITPDRPIYPN